MSSPELPLSEMQRRAVERAGMGRLMLLTGLDCTAPNLLNRLQVDLLCCEPPSLASHAAMVAMPPCSACCLHGLLLACRAACLPCCLPGLLLACRAAHPADAQLALDLQFAGGPGTGKTFTVKSIVKQWSAQGKTVLLACPTARAANVLSNAVPSPPPSNPRLCCLLCCGLLRSTCYAACYATCSAACYAMLLRCCCSTC